MQLSSTSQSSRGYAVPRDPRNRAYRPARSRIGDQTGTKPVTLVGSVKRVRTLVCGVISTTAGAVNGDTVGETPVGVEQTEGLDADRTRLTVTIQENGTAVWQVERRFALTGADSEAAFETLAADIETNPQTYVTRFEDRLAATAASTSETTGREMEITNVSVAVGTEALPEYGVVTYQFLWTKFAAVDGQQITAGDAIDGFVLEPNTQLTIRWPSGWNSRRSHRNRISKATRQ